MSFHIFMIFAVPLCCQPADASVKFGTDTVKGYDGKADGCQQEGIVCEGLGTVSVCPVKKWYPQNNGEIPESRGRPSSQGPYGVKSGPGLEHMAHAKTASYHHRNGCLLYRPVCRLPAGRIRLPEMFCCSRNIPPGKQPGPGRI